MLNIKAVLRNVADEYLTFKVLKESLLTFAVYLTLDSNWHVDFMKLKLLIFISFLPIIAQLQHCKRRLFYIYQRRFYIILT